MRDSKATVAARSASALKRSGLVLVTLLGLAQTSRSHQADQQDPERVLASKGPKAVVEFVRQAHIKGSDVIVTIKDHRHDRDPKRYPNEYVDVRLSPLDDGFLHSSVRASYLYFRDFTPPADAERRSGRASGRKRQINITVHPNRTSIQLMYGSDGFDVHSIRFVKPKLSPVTKVKSLSVVIDQKAVGRPVGGTKIDSGYRLRYGSTDDPNPWVSDRILYRSRTNEDIYFELDSSIVEEEKLGQSGIERRLTGRYLEIPAKEMHRKDAYIAACRDVRQSHKWTKFYLTIDDEGKIRGGQIGSMKLADPNEEPAR